MPSDQERDLRRFSRWARRVRFIGRFLCRTTHTPEVLPDTYGRPVVMVANHRSLSDIFIAIDALDHFDMPARCLVRAKYMQIPVAGAWLRSIGCIGAGDGTRGSVDAAVETLAGGRPVALMVEGRIIPPDKRDADGLGEFRSGFIEIARAANAVIMPIAIVGTDDLWPNRGRLPRLPWRGRPNVQVHIGESIVIDELDDDEAVAATRTAVAAHIARMS